MQSNKAHQALLLGRMSTFGEDDAHSHVEELHTGNMFPQKFDAQKLDHLPLKYVII